MNRARVIVAVIAITAAGGAAMLMKKAVKPPVQRTIVKEIAEDYVLVAARKVELGEMLTRQHLRWEAWPKKMSKHYITRRNDPQALRKYTGMIARATIQRGEPISPLKVVSKGEGGVMAALLSSGMRAIATPISAETAAGGFILPNDRVDVILSRTVKRGMERMIFSDTILRNVRVLAIGAMMENKGNKRNSGKGKSTATLELTPEQARTLAAAQEQGDLTLALRSLADVRRDGHGPQDGKKVLADHKPKEDVGSVRYLKYGVPTITTGL